MNYLYIGEEPPQCMYCGRYGTYPIVWCTCDPKLQMMRFVDPEQVITMQEPQDEPHGL